MQAAITLRDLVEREQDDAADGVDVLLLIVLDGFIRDWEVRLGLIKSPYCDNLQRLVVLKQMLRTIDKILAKMAEHSDGGDLPLAAQGLCRILSEIAFQTFMVIHALASLHPEMQKHFDAERAAYAATREMREAEHV